MIIQGQGIMPGMGLYRIVDLSRVWVVGEVYQNDLAFVKTGQQATAAVDFLPTEQFSGTVSFISPEMDPHSRTVKIRVELANTATLALKPGMTARLSVISRQQNMLLPFPNRQCFIRAGATR